jgi:hypothetical protein
MDGEARAVGLIATVPEAMGELANQAVFNATAAARMVSELLVPQAAKPRPTDSAGKLVLNAGAFDAVPDESGSEPSVV